MTARPQVHMLPDYRRLHLHHGPIDLIIEAWGKDWRAAYEAAAHRFEMVLSGLVSELPNLRRPLIGHTRFADPIAWRMARAVAPFGAVYVTPMAAVAGAVADEMLKAMVADRSLTKAYVNNGGDIAFHLSEGQEFSLMGPAGKIRLGSQDDARGIATSGWRGRSHSLGIADAVTVVASSAAQADVAATLIANAVDLPGNRTIIRQRACELSPDSDLGNRLVTVEVPPQPEEDKKTALDRGQKIARALCDRGLIDGATLLFQGQMRNVQSGAKTHAQEILTDA
ncbi:UPF0280 family protein [Roseobacter sp. EG26]|uniref:UPF0280 family protein n=1 Tax=Roseobacter sp. EG26 TaxID=3412477 RepID=UPI003CE57BED